MGVPGELNYDQQVAAQRVAIRAGDSAFSERSAAGDHPASPPVAARRRCADFIVIPLHKRLNMQSNKKMGSRVAMRHGLFFIKRTASAFWSMPDLIGAHLPFSVKVD